jgi:SAM-dependent methyltransferase
MLGNRSLFAPSQTMIDHVSGAGCSREPYFAIGYGVALDLLRYGIIRADTDKVFDIGCGCGRVGQFIATVLDEAKGGQYTGFDTWKEGVDWATETLTPLYPHARFRHIGPTIESPYDAAGAYRIALEDASHDAFIATSLFTHLRREPADYYLSEVARVLKPNGRAYISYYASKERFREIQPKANCDEDAYGIYFLKPECEDAFVEAHEVEKMAATHGLRLLGKRWGPWRGLQFAYRGLGGYQDRFMFKKV